MDISIVCPKFNISLVKYSVLEASFKKVKIWITIWLWSKHKFLCSLYFSFSRMDDATKHQLYIAPSIGKLHVMIQLLINHCITREFFARKILTLKYFFVVISFFLKKKRPYFGGNVLGKRFTTLGHKT